jgi:hypothetical protein
MQAWKGIANDVQQEIHAIITLLSAIIKEQQQVEERIKDSLNVAQETYKACKKKLEDLKVARGSRNHPL